MVAIASITASRLGELFNDAPDRISDAATLIGLGYAAGGHPVLGWLAALLAILTAYARMLGKRRGVASDFRGPVAKQHRMFIVTVVSLFCAAVPGEIAYRPAAVSLGIICVGCMITIFRRMAGISHALRSTT